jgi:hypothetical protein
MQWDVIAAAEIADSIHATTRNFFLYSLWMMSESFWISSSAPPPEFTRKITSVTCSSSSRGNARFRASAVMKMPTMSLSPPSPSVMTAIRGTPDFAAAGALASGLAAAAAGSAGLESRSILEISSGLNICSVSSPPTLKVNQT